MSNRKLIEDILPMIALENFRPATLSNGNYFVPTLDADGNEMQDKNGQRVGTYVDRLRTPTDDIFVDCGDYTGHIHASGLVTFGVVGSNISIFDGEVKGATIEEIRENGVKFMRETAATFIKSGSPKTFRRRDGIGKTKYAISYHDGIQTHKDGSPFYAIAIFKNKVKVKKFTDKLLSEGYTEE